MEKSILIFLLCFSFSLYAQRDLELEKHVQPIIEGTTGPLLSNTLKPILIINNIVLRDSVKIQKFRKEYITEIKRMNYYSKDEALEKYKIFHEDGVMVIRTKRRKIIDLD